MDHSGKILNPLYEMAHSLRKSKKLKSVEQDQLRVIQKLFEEQNAICIFDIFKIFKLLQEV